MPTSDVLTAIGLSLDVAGVVLIWIYGLPTTLPGQKGEGRPDVRDVAFVAVVYPALIVVLRTFLWIVVIGAILDELGWLPKVPERQKLRLKYFVYDVSGLLLLVVGFLFQLVGVVYPHL